MAETSRDTRRRARLWGEAALILGIVLFGCVMWMSRALLRAASVLYSFSEKAPPLSVSVYEHFFGYADRMTDLTIPGQGGAPISLRVYVPVGRRKPPTIVVLHGTAPEGNRTEGLNRLAEALVHQGFRVVLPTLPAEAQFDIAPDDLPVIASTVLWASQTDGGETVSLFGVSFGGGLAITAAERPEVKGHIRLVLDISGHNDLRAIARYYIHDPQFDPAGKPYPLEGPLGGALEFLKRYMDELVPPEDVVPMRAALMRLLASGRFPVFAGDPVLRGLTPEQQARFVHLELVNDAESKQRYRQLIARHNDDFLQVSPASVLPQLDVPLYVLHAADDRDLPEGEVEWMKLETRRGSDSHFLVTPWMRHATVKNAVSTRERIRVGSFVAEVLARAARN